MTPDPQTPVEIERKFLVRGEGWRAGAVAVSMRQGYLARSAEVVVRVRLTANEGTLTIKARGRGITTPEYEYAVPRAHAEALLELCEDAIIEKTRYRVEHDGHRWDVDVFAGANAGLVLAEIELEAEDESFSLPGWLGSEVSHDPRFKNARLCIEPYREGWLLNFGADPPEE